MEILLTLMVVLLIINRNIKTCNHHEFIKQLALATSNRYSVEYSKLRSHDESIEELNLHLHLINPCHGFMNPFNYDQFKAGICHAINTSDKSLQAELCFIHDLMLEEYKQLSPIGSSDYKVGINEFYELLREHL